MGFGVIGAHRLHAHRKTNLVSLVEESGVQGNLVFDAQIAAVCLEHGATMLLTEDRDFTRFRSLKPLTLEAFLAR